MAFNCELIFEFNTEWLTFKTGLASQMRFKWFYIYISVDSIWLKFYCVLTLWLIKNRLYWNKKTDFTDNRGLMIGRKYIAFSLELNLHLSCLIPWAYVIYFIYRKLKGVEGIILSELMVHVWISNELLCLGLTGLCLSLFPEGRGRLYIAEAYYFLLDRFYLVKQIKICGTLPGAQ